MAKVIYTVPVERDLAEIGDRIALDNPWASVAFIEAIRHHCSLLGSSPEIGRPRPDIDPMLRSLSHRPYIIFYRYLAEFDRVEVLRVWHGRRRLPTLADLGDVE